MAIDARDAAAFYATPLGRLTSELLREKLAALWPDCQNLSILGLGYAGPYLQSWQEQARCLAVSPAPMGPSAWPGGQKNLACVAEEDALPFADLSFDRILLVHGLEQADNARRILRETWRLLKDDGRLIVVAPNRRSIWAYVESTPFGHGQPYSEAQLTRLLGSLFFHVESRGEALFAPPFNWKLVHKAFAMLEKAGQRLAPQLAGLTIVEASKTMHGLIPARRQRAARRVFVDTKG